MTNHFYERAFDVIPNSFVRSLQVEAEFERIEQGFDGVETRLTTGEGFDAELTAARQGQASLLLNLGRYLSSAAPATASMDLGGFIVRNSGSPLLAGDLANKAYVDGVAFAAVLPNQAGNDGKVIRTQGGVAAWEDAWGSPVALTGAMALESRKAYHVDTTAGPVTVTLPASGWVLLRDVGRKCSQNPLTLQPTGGVQVYGAAQNYIMDQDGEALLLVVDNTKGWVRG